METQSIQEDRRDELAELRRRVRELESLLADHQAAKEELERLATFPQQNPNMVIELDLRGQITYLNPVTEVRFPDLRSLGFAHPVLSGLRDIIAALQEGPEEYVSREIEVDEAVYEQKICYTRADGVVHIRIYVHDVTVQKRAEHAVQEVARRVVMAQEEERQRVSRELHDEAGQALTALKISLQLLQTEPPAEASVLAENLGEAIDLIDETRERVRLLAQGLRPPALDTVGLRLTLEDLCHNFAQHTKLKIEYEAAALPEFTDAMSMTLYRFVQESLTNVAQHAAATRVLVRVVCDAESVRVSVEDDGRGIEDEVITSLPRRSGGLGLLGMQERIELLGGWLDIESELGRGTRLVAHLPLEPGQ